MPLPPHTKPSPRLFLFAQILIFPYRSPFASVNQNCPQAQAGVCSQSPCPNPYRAKISPSPTTAKAAPQKLSKLGRCPVRHHNNGKMITGDVADSVAMIPV